MDDKDQVLKVLGQRFLRRINFTFQGGAGDVTVTSKSFEKIVGLIKADTMHVAVDKTLTTAGEWRSGGNTLAILPIKGRYDEATVLHESLHGLFDIEKTSLLAINEEAACYVVDGLYYKMTGLRDARVDNPIDNAAKPLATQVLKASVDGSTPTVTLGATAWGKLLDAVRADSTYVPVVNAGPTFEYTHNG